MTQDWEGGTLEESGKLENDDYRCEHGTYIGDPYGPDYLCCWCEMGVSLEEYHEAMRREKHLREEANKYNQRKERLLDRMRAMPREEVERLAFDPTDPFMVELIWVWRVALRMERWL